MEPIARTLIFPSTRDPSRLMFEMNRSTMNRPRSELRMREKSAAAVPCAAMRAACAEIFAVERFEDLAFPTRPRTFSSGDSATRIRGPMEPVGTISPTRMRSRPFDCCASPSNRWSGFEIGRPDWING